MNIEQIRINGFAIATNIIEPDMIAQICQDVAIVNTIEVGSQSRQSTYGIRNILNIPSIRALANCDCIRKLVEPILGKQAIPVRGILFDKTPTANWKVAWHQDLTIAVREKIDVSGFNAWSVKAGIVCVQPPVFVMENILTIRLHLDDTSETNGALKVLPSSHCHGRMSVEEIQAWKQKAIAVTCNVPRGGVLVMRPLLLHASSVALNPSSRRVLHLEYSAIALPRGLEWYGT